MRLTINGSSISGRGLAVAGIASVGGMLFGYDTGQISDFQIMSDYRLRFAAAPDYEFSNVRSGLIVGMLSIGTLFGALFMAPLADKFSRRSAISIFSMIVAVGSIIQIASQTSWGQVVAGRIVTGFGIGALSCVIPLFIAETSPRNIRGAMGSTFQFLVTIGILIAYAISIGTHRIEDHGVVNASPTLKGSAQWRIVLGLNLLWSLFLSTAIFLCPESPRQLMRKEKIDDARNALAIIYGVPSTDPTVSDALLEIQEYVDMENAMQPFSWPKIFQKENKIRYRMLLGFFIQALQQLAGVNVVIYYSGTLFQNIGLTDTFVVQVIFGAVNTATTIPGFYFCEKLGRRKTLMAGSVVMLCSWLVYAAIGTAAENKNIDLGGPYGKAMIFATCIFLAGFASTWAPIAWVVTAETFPLRARTKLNAVAVTGNWVANFLIAFFTPFITSAISYRLGFVFVGCNALGLLVVFFFLYETSGLSLETVEDMYMDPKVRPWNSASYVPPGNFTRTVPLEKDSEPNFIEKPFVEHIDDISV